MFSLDVDLSHDSFTTVRAYKQMGGSRTCRLGLGFDSILVNLNPVLNLLIECEPFPAPYKQILNKFFALW